MPEEHAVQVRDADARDADGIAGIYNDAVAHTAAVWNTETVDSADRAAWLADRQRRGFPVLVATDDAGAVLGYASYGPWRAWDGYRHTVEHSVYVRADRRGEGIGTVLMRALIDRARGDGIHVMVAAVEGANDGSIRLHESLGFVRTGRLTQVGTKFGRWLDLVFLQCTLDDRPAPPDEPVAPAER